MGAVHEPEPVKLICGMISADEALLATAAARLVHLFGPIELQSELLPFDFTDYYAPEMGAPLLRRFVAFARAADPSNLVEAKLATQVLEAEWTVAGAEGRPRRRINLDPGYVCASKLVLATTKDFAHRIYLRQGIYAEVTLNFGKEGLRFFPWTYPDFKSGAYAPFLLEVRRRAMQS